MFYLHHRYVRKKLVEELIEYFKGHPFYTPNNTDDTLQKAPVVIADKFTFEGRQFPAILINTTSSSEQVLGVDKSLYDVEGHVRFAHRLPYIIAKLYEYDTSVTHINAVYKFEIVNIDKENREELKLRVSYTDTNGDVVINYYDVAEDGRYDNIIPGTIINFGSDNMLRPGASTYVETFEKKRLLGTLYASRFQIDLNMEIFAQSQYELEDLVDFVAHAFVYVLPESFIKKYGISITDFSSSGIYDREGEYGEEVFKGTMSSKLSVEDQFFDPYPIVENYTLFLELRKKLDSNKEVLIKEVGRTNY